MLNSPLMREKREICNNNIFLENIHNLTHADVRFLLVLVFVYLFDFSLVLMVDSK